MSQGTPLSGRARQPPPVRAARRGDPAGGGAGAERALAPSPSPTWASSPPSGPPREISSSPSPRRPRGRSAARCRLARQRRRSPGCAARGRGGGAQRGRQLAGRARLLARPQRQLGQPRRAAALGGAHGQLLGRRRDGAGRGRPLQFKFSGPTDRGGVPVGWGCPRTPSAPPSPSAPPPPPSRSICTTWPRGGGPATGPSNSRWSPRSRRPTSSAREVLCAGRWTRGVDGARRAQRRPHLLAVSGSLTFSRPLRAPPQRGGRQLRYSATRPSGSPRRRSTRRPAGDATSAVPFPRPIGQSGGLAVRSSPPPRPFSELLTTENTSTRGQGHDRLEPEPHQRDALPAGAAGLGRGHERLGGTRARPHPPRRRHRLRLRLRRLRAAARGAQRDAGDADGAGAAGTAQGAPHRGGRLPLDRGGAGSDRIYTSAATTPPSSAAPPAPPWPPSRTSSLRGSPRSPP